MKADLAETMTKSYDWWPADFGHYGPFFIRMAWHSAGTYRSHDGRGGGGAGQQRFAPLNSWPDNVNLDKARRLLWPVKKKYGQSISWADLMILAGNVAMETMGFKTFGFAGGRPDVWEADDDVYWGPEKVWLDNERYTGTRDLGGPAGSRPDGPDLREPGGPGRRRRSAGLGHRHPRNLPPHGHGRRGDRRADRRRPHLRQDPRRQRRVHKGADPEAAPLEMQGLGWKSGFGTGHGDDTIGSGLEVTWTYHPTRWDNEFFHILFAYEWEMFHSAAGAQQWRPKDGGGADLVPMAHNPAVRREPRMLTSDLALRFDPAYGEISRRFQGQPGEVRRRLRPRLVQADPPRHGPEVPLPGQGGSGRGPALAGSAAGRSGRDLGRCGNRGTEGPDRRVGPERPAAGLHRVEGRCNLPFLGQARRRQRRPHPPGAAGFLDREPARAAGAGHCQARGNR